MTLEIKLSTTTSDKPPTKSLSELVYGRPEITEKEAEVLLLQKVEEKANDPSPQKGISEKMKAWMEDERLPKFVYEKKAANPNEKVATIKIGEKELGKVIIVHKPLTRESFTSRLLARFFKLPYVRYREMLQFINRQGKTLLLEISDGSIPTDSNHRFLKEDSYLPETDQFSSDHTFITTFFQFIVKLHEYGHAYRVGLMKQENKKQFIEDTTHYFDSRSTEITNQHISPDDEGRQNRIFTEEIAASATAIAEMNDILTFLEIDTLELPLDLLLNIYADAALSYKPKK
jgi:hypothetical protein